VDWSKVDSNILSITNIKNRVNADILFVSLVMEMEKRYIFTSETKNITNASDYT
jgi:hypothetical protein